jgi:predicted ATPase
MQRRPRAPHLWVLVTSQRRFRVPVGKSYEMSGLAVPPEEATAEPPGSAERIADFGAVQLFVERVEAVDDRFELTDGNAAAVAEICRSTDGNPLSLELAAVRVPALRIEGIRARLDRLPSILNRGSPLGPERQLSLNNMLDWSFGTLNAAEQHAYCCLGIFPANFSADAAITLIGADGTSPDAAADILCELVENSMVRAEDGADPCYRLHEAMQDHAREKLKASVEYDLIAERLVRYLIDLFIQADAAWQSMPEAEWLTLYEAEIDNVRTALDWALADSARSTLAIELTGVAARLWDTSGRLADGRRYLDRAVNLLGPDTSPEAAARVLRYAGILWRSADRLRAVALLEQSVALYRQIGDIPSLGAVLATIGSDSVYLGRYEVARSTLAEAAEILPPGDRVKSSVNVLNSLGSLALALNDTAEAERCFTQARDQARILRNALLENIYILNLGEVEFRLGAIDRAIDRAREGTGGLRSANLPSYLVCALVNFASYLALRGDQAEARIIAEEALPLAREQGGHWLRLCLQLWALLGAADGRYSDAARLLDWVDADYSRAGEIREFTEQQIYAALSKLLAGNLAEDGHRVRGLEGSIWAEQRAVEFAQQCLVSPKA